MAISNWPENERPREKLLKFGSESLSDAELLAIFLRTGTRGSTAVDIARDLLIKFNGLRGIMAASPSDLCSVVGIGLAKVVQIQAVLALSQRYLYAGLGRTNAFTSSHDVQQYLKTKMALYQSEVFACLFLDNQHFLLDYQEVARGTINSAVVYPREIVKNSLKVNAAAVIFAHNHPSGNSTPSDADKQLTGHLVKALSLVDIRVLDHIVVGADSCSSFSELGILD